MIILNGKYNSAEVFTENIDNQAIAQIIALCSQPFSAGSKIRIMPDVHAGSGCTIGTTMTIKDKACPNIVGVDIGCGMLTVKLQDKEIDFEGRFFIVDFFFCRNIAKMQWKARKNGYFYIRVASRNITTEVQ